MPTVVKCPQCGNIHLIYGAVEQGEIIECPKCAYRVLVEGFIPAQLAKVRG